MNAPKKWLVSTLLLMVLLATGCAVKEEGESTSLEPTGPDVFTSEPDTVETTKTLEVADNISYFEPSPDSEDVIALRELMPSEYPPPHGIREEQMLDYEKLVFFEVLVVTSDKEETHVTYISAYKPSRVDDVYRTMSIRYEDGYAIFKHYRDYHVVELSREPKLYKTPVPFYETYVKKQTESPETVYISGMAERELIFDIADKQFEDGYDGTFKFWTDPYDWSSKTLTHMPADREIVPITNALTDDPILLKLALGESTEQLFSALGNPISKGWILGDYLAYEDLMVYTMVDETPNQLSLYPIRRINYYGDHAIAGIKIGMTFKEVESMLGPFEQLIFTEGAEDFYPLTLQHIVGHFMLQIDFNTDLTVNDLSLMRYEEAPNQSDPESLNAYFQQILDLSQATAASLVKEGALMSQVETVSYAYDNHNAVYFTIENESPGVKTGLYRYDMTTKTPKRLTEQPMAIVFEISGELNPSVVALGLEDGKLYKIDINRLITTPVSGLNYKNHLPIYGTLILDPKEASP